MEKHNNRGFYCISGVLEFRDGKFWGSKLNIFGYHNYSNPITSLDLFEFSQPSDLSEDEEISKIDVPIFLLEVDVECIVDIFGSSYYRIFNHFNETELMSSFSIQSIYDFVRKTLEEDKIKIRRVWRLTP